MAVAMHSNDPIRDALAQLVDFGLEVSGIELDGALHRVRHREDRAGTKNGWYVAHEFSTTSGRRIVCGAFGWWKSGDAVHRLKHDGAGLSIDDQREADARRRDLEAKAAAARSALAAETADRARKIWPALPTDGASEYLARKQVAAFGVRFSRGSVVVPLRRGLSDADLVGLQWIGADGAKRFLTGTAKRGAWCLLGDPPEPGGWLAIGEGYATCASVRMAMGWTVAVAFDAGNLSEVAKALGKLLPGVRIVLLADDDHATKGNPGVSKATAAARSVRGLVAIPRFCSDDPARGTDWNDLHVSEGLDAVRGQLGALARAAGTESDSRPAQPPNESQSIPTGAQGGKVVSGRFPGSEWADRLMRTEKGAVRSTSFNARLILMNDPAWRGVLGWCGFSHSVRKRELPPLHHAALGEWGDADDAELRYWMAERYGIEPKGQDLADAVLGAASAVQFHPVHEYLDSLRWDGKPRVHRWLIEYLGCGSEDALLPVDERPRDRTRYLEVVGSKYLIQAISRIRYPGLKADSVLILEGAQGRGKSTALRTLFGDDWFSDTPIDIGSKDAYEAIRGLWGIELAELDSLNKADHTRAKAFFSSPKDRFRMPYGHRSKIYTRQCVVAGTTNQHLHLRDYTGNRRYWSATVGVIDIESLAKDRDQLWAEAEHLYRSGIPWWPDREDQELFEEEQDARLDGDVWESILSEWLREKILWIQPADRPTFTVTMAQLMGDVLKIDAGSMRRPEQTRVGQIMIGLGWRSCKPVSGSQRVRGYRPGRGYLERISGVQTQRAAQDIPAW